MERGERILLALVLYFGFIFEVPREFYPPFGHFLFVFPTSGLFPPKMFPSSLPPPPFVSSLSSPAREQRKNEKAREGGEGRRRALRVGGGECGTADDDDDSERKVRNRAGEEGEGGARFSCTSFSSGSGGRWWLRLAFTSSSPPSCNGNPASMCDALVHTRPR